MFKSLIAKNHTLASILLFLFLFLSISFFKPRFLYCQDGSIRQFGIGSKNKTILPIWLLAIILGIISYVVVIYFSSHY